jgi:hypothetical protein
VYKRQVKLQFTYQEDMVLVIPAAPSKLVIEFSRSAN